MIGRVLGHAHWVNFQMYYLEAIGVKQWSKKEESPPLTLRCTSRSNIHTWFMAKSGSGSRRVGIGWEHMILPGVEDPHNCLDPWNLGCSKCDQSLDTIEWLFSLYHKRMSTYSRVRQIYIARHSVHLHYPCIPIHLPFLVEDVLGGRDRASLKIHMETNIN